MLSIFWCRTCADNPVIILVLAVVGGIQASVMMNLLLVQPATKTRNDDIIWFRIFFVFFSLLCFVDGYKNDCGVWDVWHRWLALGAEKVAVIASVALFGFWILDPRVWRATWNLVLIATDEDQTLCYLINHRTTATSETRDSYLSVNSSTLVDN